MDDKPETPINPYQSPTSGAVSQEAACPDRDYGLKQPIRVEGKLSAEDVWPTEKLTRGQQIRTVSWHVFLVAVAVCITMAAIVFSLLSLSIVIFLVAFLAIDMARYLFAIYARKRRNRKFERNASWEKTTISDGELVVEGEHGRSIWRWSAFCQCRYSDRQVLLFIKPQGDRLVFPKRFFADDGDWEAFADLVRFKLPEDDASARELAKSGRKLPAAGAPSPEEASETEDREEAPPLIQVEGAVSWNDWKHVRKRIGRPWLDRATRVGCLLPLVAVLALLFWLTPSMALAWPLLIALAVITLLLFFPLFVFTPLKLRRQWKQQEAPFEPFQIRIWDDRVEYAGPTSTGTVLWTAFAKFTLTDRVLLLHQSRPNVVRFIPRAFFSSDEEWKNLVGLVRRKLSETPDDATES